MSLVIEVLVPRFRRRVGFLSMNMQRLTLWLVLVPLILATGVLGQTCQMSDGQTIDYVMQRVRELQAWVKELKTTQQQKAISTPTRTFQ